MIPVSDPGVVRRRRAARFKLPHPVLPDGFQQPVASWSRAGVVELHEVLIDQGAEQSDDLLRAHALTQRDRLGRGRPTASSWKICSGRPRSLSRCEPRSRRNAPSGRRSRSKAAVEAESTTWPPWATAAILAAVNVQADEARRRL
jgi:hypothetical protein